MTKRILSMVIAIVMVIGLIPTFSIGVGAAEVASGTAGDISWKLTDDGTLTFSGTGAIPGYTLTARPDWYAFEAQIKKVVIESGITKVGNNAFNGCSVLSEVILPDTLTEIRNNVFYDCTNLSYVEYWGTTAPTLGMGVFNGCDNLLVVNVPTNYEGDAFTRGLNISKTLVASAATMTGTTGDCTWTFDDTTGTLTISGNGAMAASYTGGSQPWYDHKDGFTTVIIEKGVTSISEYAFYNFSALETVKIAGSVTSIGQNAFSQCTSLSSVEYYGTTEISTDNAFVAARLFVINVPTTYESDYFCGKTALKTLEPDEADDEGCSHETFADGSCTACGIMGGYCGAETNEGGEQSVYWTYDATTGAFSVVGNGAMKEYSSYTDRPWNNICTMLTSLTISEGVTQITQGAFMLFTQIKEVTIPASVESLDMCAFTYCEALETVTFAEGSRLTVIGQAAFEGNYNLTQIILPASVKEVAQSAFYDCRKLTGIQVEDGSTFLKAIDGVLYSADGTTLLLYPYGKADAEFTTPVGVNTIGAHSFDYCNPNLQVVTLSEGVTTIEDRAFFCCENLHTITIPASVTEIRYDAFYDCFTLTVNAPCNWDGSLYTFADSVTVNIPDHSYGTNGLCGGCGGECPHEQYTGGACDVCGMNCPHETYANGFCTDCDGYQPAIRNENGYYEIGNAGQLYWFMEYVNARNTTVNAILTADIVVNEGVLVNGKLASDTTGFRAWTSIGFEYQTDDGTKIVRYAGVFDGAGHTVSGLYLNNPYQGSIGLLGETASGSIVKNVGVVDSYFNGSSFCGGVVGSNGGRVENCYSTSVVIGLHTAGGVVGSNGGVVRNCYNTGSVSGTSSIGGVGGVVGSNGGVVRNCYNTGTVNCSDYVGGVVGHGFKGSSIEGCYNAGSVNGDDYVGGVIGFNLGELKRCFFDRDVFSGNSVGFSDSEEGFVTVAGMTTGDFKNGTVAYMLGDAFGQNLSEGGDLLPVFRTEDNVVYYDWVQGVYTNHGHVWTYTADGATITATCSNEDGDCSAPVQTVTLVAPADPVYNGARKELDFEGTVDGGVPRLTYTSDATSVGTHTVSMSWGDATASVTFTIVPCPHENFTDGVCDHCDHTGPCSDGNRNHKCDVCNASVQDHTDGDDADHLCDYCQGDVGETCCDLNTDHACDECGATGVGEHTDGDDTDHLCDYGCGEIADEGCYDLDTDHACDECGATGVGEHADGDDADHLCDYCQGDVGETCYDVRMDHICDECGATGVGEHKAEEGKHKCRYCIRPVTTCGDADHNGVCDICGDILDVEAYALAGLATVSGEVANVIADATLDALETAVHHVTEDLETLAAVGYNEVVQPATAALGSFFGIISGCLAGIASYF